MCLRAAMRAKAEAKVITFWSGLQTFLFAKDFREQLGIFRFILCGTLFYMACYRQFNMDQLGVDSLIPRTMALQVFPDFYRPLVQWFFWPDAYVGFVHMILIILLFLATLGLTSRPLLLLTWILHQGILNRNYAILFGADVIGSLFLFYLCFTKCCDFFSVKNYFLKYPNEEKTPTQQISISTVFVRLMQVQICTIYMYTGFEKLKGNTWWDGTALWTVFANPQFSQYDFTFLRRVPLFFAVGTFLSILFEIYFPAMMMNKSLRKYWLVAGILFHLGIGMLLGLMTFSFVMVSTYVLFIQSESVIFALEKVKLFLWGFRKKSVSN